MTTQLPEKPTIEEVMEHFGVMGMHWGVRKGKGTTGVSRSSGVLLDRNTRDRKTLNDAHSGKKYRISVAIGKKILGDKKWERNFQTSMKDMKDQDARLKKGKLTVMDRVDKFANVSLFELAVSVTPKK